MKYSPRVLTIGALALWLAGQGAAVANVKMPAIFGDHMVLQQGMPVPIWGTADAGETVKVTVTDPAGKLIAGTEAVAGTNGALVAGAPAPGPWSVKLAPLQTSAQPVTVTVTGSTSKLTFTDVLIGEVWVCSGQSNMEFALAAAHNGKTELPTANDPQLRIFLVMKKEAHTPEPDVVGKWEVCTPATVAKFSAVGYFFGKELRAKLNRPVGLIGSYWGGTPAEAWTSVDGLGKEPALAHYVERWKQIDAGYQKAVAEFPAARAAFTAAMTEWNAKYGKDFAAAMAKWKTDTAAAIQAGQSPPPRPIPAAPKPPQPGDPVGGPSAPASLYDGMIAPIEPYAIRGTIWYQGEANAGRAEEYRTLFPRMIKDWREKWGEGDFPFLWVQLAGFHADDTENWPNLRDAQLQTLSLPATGMATAVDIGLPGNIHPMDKVDVGKRLALAARHVAYGEDLVYSGPIFQSVKKDGNGLRLEFHDLGGGLAIGQAPWVGPGAPTLPTDHLVGFEVAGADGQWKPADAKIDGAAVVVSSADVQSPDAVRYDWKAYPGGNLYNKDGLPASPFHAKIE